MSNKSWKAKHRRNQPDEPAHLARDPPIADQLQTLFGRITQAEIYAELKRKYRGDVPAPVAWDHLADRRELVTSSASRVRFARG